MTDYEHPIDDVSDLIAELTYFSGLLSNVNRDLNVPDSGNLFRKAANKIEELADHAIDMETKYLLLKSKQENFSKHD